MHNLLQLIKAMKRKTNERMQLMFESAPLAVTFLDMNYKVIDCNENTVKLFGLASKEEYVEKFHALLPKYQPDGNKSKIKRLEIIRKTLAEGYSRFEWMFQKLNGQLIPCEVTLVRVKYKRNFVVVGYLRDLREEKKMLTVLNRQAHLLDTVNTAASLLLTGSDTHAFETTLLKCFNLIGNCLDVDRVQIWRNEKIDGDIHFVLRHEWLSQYGKSCKTIPIGLSFPYQIKPEWEKLFLRGGHINSPVSMLSEEEQSFLGYYGMKSVVMLPMFLEDIFWGFFYIDDCRHERTFTEVEINILTSAGLMMTSSVNRNIQNIKMHEAEERMQIMIDAAPLCACFWDEHLALVDCNLEAVKMFDVFDKQEFIDKFILLSPEYQPCGESSISKGIRLVKKALEEGFSRFEWMHQKLNGEQIPVEVTCTRVKYKNKFIVIEYIRDLREQQAMLREMQKAEIAEESNRAKSNFLARMSHEIRTPMNAILGITEIQLQDQSLRQVTKQAFERILSSGNLLLGIINDILDLSKIEAGKLELIPVQYNLPSLIQDAVQLNIVHSENKPVDFLLNVNENLPLLFYGNELRIKQIINNILSNAFKYTDVGMITMTVSAEPCPDGGDVILVIEITDTGHGMSEEQINMLGSEYMQFNTETNRKTDGTGLGMNIVMNLVKLMNGVISIKSTPDVGSSFTVRLPQKRIGTETIGKECAEKLTNLNYSGTTRMTAAQVNQEFMPYGKILVVDDIETNLYVARGLLTPYGLSIDTAASGFEAVEKIKNGYVYDVIFMDYMMHKMDGIEATQIIRKYGYTNPIVALTANAIAGQAEVFLSNGFDDFISKPIDIRQLNAVLNRLVRDKQPPDVLEKAHKQKAVLYSAISQKDVSRQLADIFLRDANKSIKLLELVLAGKFRNNDDISLFVINTHSMKSALANIGEQDLSAEAKELEQAGREQNIEFMLAKLPGFLERLSAVKKKLQAKNNANETKSSEDSDISLLKAKLLEIQAACAEYKKKDAKKALTELMERQWQALTKELLCSIDEKLLHSEFEKIIDDISNFFKQA